MALSMVTVLAQLRALLSATTGINEVYAVGETGSYAIPDAITDFPAVLIFPGADISYNLVNFAHRHVYEVSVQVLTAGPDQGERSAEVLPLIDAIITKFAANVKLGSRVEYCLYRSQSGFAQITYGGQQYVGYEVILEVSEYANITAEVGS